MMWMCCCLCRTLFAEPHYESLPPQHSRSSPGLAIPRSGVVACTRPSAHWKETWSAQGGSEENRLCHTALTFVLDTIRTEDKFASDRHKGRAVAWVTCPPAPQKVWGRVEVPDGELHPNDQAHGHTKS
ncbi:hypothetical protein HOY80DRAFT_582121 [Tuber brumale]|nr:hypothetical protein HOY80DRAFT_582121 [Tuber brumale]